MITTMRLLGTLAVLLASAARADGLAWVNLTTDQGLPGNEIQFLRQADDGAIWIGTLSGLGIYRDGKCETVVSGLKVWDALPAGDGRYWIGAGRGVHLVENGKKGKPQLAGFSVAPLLEVGGGEIWAIAKEAKGQKSFVARLQGDTWSAVEPLAGHKAKDLFRSAAGQLWLTVEGDGLLEIPSRDAPEDAVRHLEGRDVTAFQEDRDGRIWCGTWGSGLFVLERGIWRRLLEKEKSAILDIDQDGDGRIWVATSANGLWRQDGKEWRHELRKERGINLMEPTSNGRVWISNQARGGLRYWNGKDWVQSLPGPLPMRCMLEADDGTIWVGGVLDGVHVLRNALKE